MSALRGTRGAAAVHRLGAEPCDAESIVRAARAAAASHLAVPPVEVVWSSVPSRARPPARGRYLAGVITLFPAALADPYTLAWTTLHELAHAAGLDEPGADAFAASFLVGEPPCSSPSP
jgi:hypothetical protein